MRNYNIKRNFLLNCERHNLGKSREMRYIQIFNELKKMNIDLERLNQKSLDKYFFYLKNSHYAEWTKLTNWRMFKKICRFVKPNINFSEYVFKTPKIEPNILTLEEIYNIVITAKNFRDKLIILLLYESGMRIGELLNLNKKDIYFDSNGALLKVYGKTGSRMIRVVRCADLLKSYMKLMNSERLFNIKRENVNVTLKDLARRVGITKKVYPHLFRHTRATHLAKFLTEPELKIFFGWAKDSNMPSTYVHLSMRDLDEKVLKIMNEEKKNLLVFN